MEEDYVVPENPARFLVVFHHVKVVTFPKLTLRMSAGKTGCFPVPYNYDSHRY